MLYEVPLPPNQVVDIYAHTGIAIGTKILAQNIGRTIVGIKAPEDECYTQLGLMLFAENESGDTGALALSNSLPGLIAVQVSS